MLQQKSIEFLADLKTNNNREWFHQNKTRYDLMKKDYLGLAEALLKQMQPHDKNFMHLEPKNCVFRINRDIRFSKDKSPYKTNLGIWLAGNAKGGNQAGYYVHIEDGNCFVAGGFYNPEPNDLRKIRNEINFFYEDFEQIIQNLAFKENYEDLEFNDNNSLKNPPKGFDKTQNGIQYIKLKSFIATKNFKIDQVYQTNFVDQVIKDWLVLQPFVNFLNRSLTIE